MDLISAIHDATSLPVPERIRLVQAIWDSLPDDIGNTLTQEQAAELDRRLQSHDADPSSAISRDDLIARLRTDT